MECPHVFVQQDRGFMRGQDRHRHLAAARLTWLQGVALIRLQPVMMFNRLHLTCSYQGSLPAKKSTLANHHGSNDGNAL
jgi:hypothetical protein